MRQFLHQQQSQWTRMKCSCKWCGHNQRHDQVFTKQFAKLYLYAPYTQCGSAIVWWLLTGILGENVGNHKHEADKSKIQHNTPGRADTIQGIIFYNQSQANLIIDKSYFIRDSTSSKNLPQFSWASLGCVLTAPQRVTALHKTKTLHYTAGGPQIIQYLSEYKEEQPEGGGRDRRGQTGLEFIYNWLH